MVAAFPPNSVGWLDGWMEGGINSPDGPSSRLPPRPCSFSKRGDVYSGLFAVQLYHVLLCRNSSAMLFKCIYGFTICCVRVIPLDHWPTCHDVMLRYLLITNNIKISHIQYIYILYNLFSVLLFIFYCIIIISTRRLCFWMFVCVHLYVCPLPILHHSGPAQYFLCSSMTVCKRTS